LEQKLDYVLRQLFGAKSEKLDPAQLELLLEGLVPGKSPAPSDDETSAPEEDGAKRKGKKRGANRSRITGLEDLAVETTEIIPDCVQADPDAFERCEGGEVTELLDITPAKLFRRRILRPKFRRKHQRELPPVVAPAPVTPLVGGLPAAGLLAHLLVGKYVDHLPLYRQQKIFLRERVGIPRDLIVHWIQQSIGLLLPVADAIRLETLSSNYLQVDETPVRFLEPGRGKAPQGYLWVANDPTGSLYYHWGVGRGRDQLIECIGDEFHGDMQSDGYSVYTAYAKRVQSTDLIACLAHIRRPFLELLGSSRPAAQILRLIGELYHIETELREKKAGPALRESERAWRSAPIVRRLGKIFGILLPKHRPQSLMGKALAYALGHWDRFARYLEDGRFEIDNNLVENCMRPVKLGAKNYLFFGSRNAGHHAAAIYTLVENCKRQGVPVESYLKHLLEVLPGMSDPEAIAALTPARVAAASKQAAA
jgi:transposase